MQLKQEDRAMQIRNILAPTDFSDASNQAVMYAFGLARACGAKLSLLHVVEPLAFPLDGYIPPDLITTLLDDLKREAYMRLAHLLCEAGAANVKVTRHVVVGVPYETILETAEAEHVNLIVMATRGRTGLSHLVLGSVAERVVRLAPCPVLTVRATA
jgi:nucleotide-binding universal stress UspA family protein